MNFEQFNIAINAIKEQQGIDTRFDRAMREFFPDAGLLLYNNSPLLDALLKVLEHDTDDNNKWIEYFIWELDFGREWKPGTVTENGIDIKLETNEDLWELLIKKATE